MREGRRETAVPNTAAPLGELPPASGPIAIFVGTAWYGPNQTTLMVVGDVGLDDAVAATEANLGDWPAALLTTGWLRGVER